MRICHLIMVQVDLYVCVLDCKCKLQHTTWYVSHINGMVITFVHGVRTMNTLYCYPYWFALSLREYCSSYLQISRLLSSISKLLPSFWKVKYASYSKLSKELKKQHQNLGRPSGTWVSEPNNILTVLIHNLQHCLSSKISMPSFEFLEQYIIRCIFQEGADYFEIEHKIC